MDYGGKEKTKLHSQFSVIGGVAYNQKDAGFQLRRITAAREITALKTAAYSVPGGPFNYLEQLRALPTRLKSDFADALHRMYVIRRGLKELYGYDAPALPLSWSVTQLDDAMLWLRDAVDFILQAHGILDQCIEEYLDEHNPADATRQGV